MREFVKTSRQLIVKILLVSGIVWLSLSCAKQRELKTGAWQGVLHIQGQRLPFNFEISRQTGGLYGAVLINDRERLEIDSVFYDGDSVEIPMYIFDAVIRARNFGDSLAGWWIKPYAEDYEIRFQARHGVEERFSRALAFPSADVSGKWQVYFFDDKDTTEAIGLFEQDAGELTGTFLTATGDYRFLEGSVGGDSLFLSAFNGTDAHLFKGRITGDSLVSGDFYSGKGGYKRWIANRNESASLRSADSLTYLKPGYERIGFSFPALDGGVVSLNDPRFKNKPVIIQIMGSWCRNCMDETRFLSSWRRQNAELPVEIVALAFERKDDIEYARKQLSRYIEKFDIDYPILFAGSKDKENVEKALPALNRLMAFPTTIFLDSDHHVRKIHTGFSGPGTGEYYDQFVVEFNEFVAKLVEEKGV